MPTRIASNSIADGLPSDTIFAFLTLNTMSSAHNKIFGAKFLSFERAAITYLRTVDYADSGKKCAMNKGYKQV